MDIHAARAAAKAVEAYWASRGVRVKAVAVTEYHGIGGKLGSHFHYTVRTSPPLIGGVPQGLSAVEQRRLFHLSRKDK